MYKQNVPATQTPNNNQVASASAANVPAIQSEFTDFGFTGHEDITLNDVKVPLLVLVQANSKDLLDRYKDLKAGMVINTVTDDITDITKEPLIAIPLFYKKNYHVEEVKEKGSKTVAKIFELPKSAQHVPNTAYWIDTEDPNENRIYECYNYFFALPDFSVAQISLKKSKLKIGKKLNTLFKQKNNLPLFRFKYAISSLLESGDKGDYYNFNFQDFEPCSVEEYNKAGAQAQTVIPLANELLTTLHENE